MIRHERFLLNNSRDTLKNWETIQYYYLVSILALVYCNYETLTDVILLFVSCLLPSLQHWRTTREAVGEFPQECIVRMNVEVTVH